MELGVIPRVSCFIRSAVPVSRCRSLVVVGDEGGYVREAVEVGFVVSFVLSFVFVFLDSEYVVGGLIENRDELVEFSGSRCGVRLG